MDHSKHQRKIWLMLNRIGPKCVREWWQANSARIFDECTQNVYFDVKIDNQLASWVVIGVYGLKWSQYSWDLQRSVQGKKWVWQGSALEGRRLLASFDLSKVEISHTTGCSGAQIYGSRLPMRNFCWQILVIASAWTNANGLVLSIYIYGLIHFSTVNLVDKWFLSVDIDWPVWWIVSRFIKVCINTFGVNVWNSENWWFHTSAFWRLLSNQLKLFKVKYWSFKR